MNKKILISLSVIGIVAAIAIGGTVAFFSDTETSTGNTFTAGTLDLKIDSTCHYYQNGQSVDCKDATDVSFGTWTLTDLEDGVHKFFAFDDVKPGDYGEDTISLHVYDNDAWVCVTLGPFTNDDNGCTEPEASDGDTSCGPTGEGELAQNLDFFIWEDNGKDGLPGTVDEGEGDNIWQKEWEEVLVEGPLSYILEGVTWPIADSNTDGPLEESHTYYLGVGWSISSGVGNIIQSDSVSGNITFYIEQARNNPNFICQ